MIREGCLASLSPISTDDDEAKQEHHQSHNRYYNRGDDDLRRMDMPHG